MKCFYQKLLQGVDVVHNSLLPGKIIVYGEHAEPVLTGNAVEDVIIAAAKLGKGRVVAFSHDAFGSELTEQKKTFKNSLLYDNVKKWLLGRSTSPCKYLKLDTTEQVKDAEGLKEYDIVVSLAGAETIPSCVVMQYVKSGGAFVHSATPWGWSMLNPDKGLSEMPYLDVLNEAGITYSAEPSGEDGRDLSCADNKALWAHLGKCLTEASSINGVVERIGLIGHVKEVPCLPRKGLVDVFAKHWDLAYGEAAKLVRSGKIESRTEFEKKILDICTLGVELLNRRNFKACGIKHFPGDFSEPPPLSCRRLTLRSDIQDFHFTSCYVPAGSKVALKVTKIRNVWTVLVGAHSDRLTDERVQRWPDICLRHEISAPVCCDISSPFGGSVYFLSPDEADSFVEASIEGVAACPRFDSLDPDGSWEESRRLPGLWADISGRHVTVTLPSSSVRDLDAPREAMEMYDKLLEAYHDLRGTDIAAERRIWIVADVQTSVGYMHSGYPIVTHLNVADPIQDGFLLSTASSGNALVDAKWGIFHEIGHNMQQDEWTFSGTVEVTVNIFSLYGMEVIFGVPAWIHPWLRQYFQAAVDYLNGGADFQEWKESPEVALFVYAQLVASFGWPAFKAVFRRYRDERDLGGAGEAVSLSDQEKVDRWFVTFSEVAERNLSSLAVLWGIPLSAKALTGLRSLGFDHFIPDDELTRKVPDRMEYVKGQL